MTDLRGSRPRLFPGVFVAQLRGTVGLDRPVESILAPALRDAGLHFMG